MHPLSVLTVESLHPSCSSGGTCSGGGTRSSNGTGGDGGARHAPAPGGDASTGGGGSHQEPPAHLQGPEARWQSEPMVFAVGDPEVLLPPKGGKVGTTIDPKRFVCRMVGIKKYGIGSVTK